MYVFNLPGVCSNNFGLNVLSNLIFIPMVLWWGRCLKVFPLELFRWFLAVFYSHPLEGSSWAVDKWGFNWSSLKAKHLMIRELMPWLICPTNVILLYKVYTDNWITLSALLSKSYDILKRWMIAYVKTQILSLSISNTTSSCVINLYYLWNSKHCSSVVKLCVRSVLNYTTSIIGADK